MKTNPFIWVQLTRYLWLLFLLYWIASARKLKTVKRREPPSERVVYILFMAATYFLMFNDRMEGTWLSTRFLPLSSRIGAIGFALAAAGIALAFWARWHLGENWSATVTLKQGHELIRSGPYRRIRHPIYTGMLLALAGTALALGEIRGVLSVAIAVASFYGKAKKEERYLVQEFGSSFQEHLDHTGMFLPKLEFRN